MLGAAPPWQSARWVRTLPMPHSQQQIHKKVNPTNYNEYLKFNAIIIALMNNICNTFTYSDSPIHSSRRVYA